MNSVAKSFSKAAFKYEQNADIQKDSAKKLVSLIPNNLDIESFIDIGSGTGFASLELLKVFPIAKVALLDVSKEMLELASTKIPQATVFNADAETFDFKKYKFDMAIANLSIHWFKSFKQSVTNIINSSKYFAFSIPLDKSFLEYENIFLKSNHPSPTFKYHSYEDILKFISEEASIIACDHFVVRKDFPNAISAAKHFKDIGANVSSSSLNQSRVAMILKNHKTPLAITYDLFLCVLKRKE